MSIQVRDNDSDDTPLAFNGGVSEIPATFYSKPILVQESKPIEAPKKKKLAKKKELKTKLFYELLADNYHKRRFNRLHSDSFEDDLPNSYSCPILCIAGDLGICDVRYPHQTKKRVSNGCDVDDHVLLSERIYNDKHVKCINTEIPCPLCNAVQKNEPMLAFHLASHHNENNLKVSEILKLLYKDGKPRPIMLPKTDFDSDSIMGCSPDRIFLQVDPFEMKKELYHVSYDSSFPARDIGQDDFVYYDNVMGETKMIKRNRKTGEITVL